MTRDVDSDEQAALASIAKLRQSSAISFETIGFMLGTGGNHISRYFNRTSSISLNNYLRIARSLGYRCKFVFERVDDKNETLASLNDVSHRVQSLKSPPQS
jgi:hypothetical protein